MANPFFLFLLTLFLFIENSRSLTFSWKLIHRFSDEAKEIRVSRNGQISGSWPKPRSFDYYRLLVRSDLDRQKMKLGNKYQLLFPSEGSKTMSFGNDFGWLHYTWIDIGTPNVSFLVALDTGSDLLWVPCDCVQCAPLSASYSRLDKDLSEYSPAKSSTSKHLPCSHELCTLGHCNNPKQPCPYTINYYSENTSSSGLLVQDTLYLSSSSDHASSTSVKAPVIIGCGRKQSGGYLDGIAPDGLLGLGFGNISVPSFLAKNGLVRNSFSMCFDEDDSGRIFFGDQGISTQQSTPFLAWGGEYLTYFVEVEGTCIGTACLKQTGFRALFDSGSSFTYLPDDAYKKVSEEFNRQMNASRFTYEGSSWEYCYKASSLESPKIPTMTIMFAVNGSFVVHDPTFQTYGQEGEIVLCLALQSTGGNLGVIGQNLMTGFRLVFDRENLKLGWSRSNCKDLDDADRVPLIPPPQDLPENPLPTNQQQSSPGGRAVPPATAVRAPSRSSASSPYVSSTFCLVRLLLLILGFSIM